MSTSPAPNRDYCDDLLIQQAVYGLNASEQREMNELIRQFDLTDADRFDEVVGALDAGSSTSGDDLPTDLQTKVLSEASSYVGWVDSVGKAISSQPAPSSTAQPRPPGWTTREKFFGLVTAASLLLALLTLSGMFGPIGTEPTRETPSVAQQMETLLASATDVKRMEWTNPTNDPASAATTGEVVWSDAQQKGFMVFEQLAVNNPIEQQYQLWIFDTSRTDELPVDGGVFDITSEGELIIPIDAKLSIAEAKAFAVTIERSGGVVQSKRTRLPLLAGNL